MSYLERARALRPRIAAAADQIERDRRIPEPLLDALHDAGFFRLLLPRSFDGGELDPVTLTLVVEEIARADASTAWILCQTAGCSMTAAYVPPDVAREIFGDRRAVRARSIASPSSTCLRRASPASPSRSPARLSTTLSRWPATRRHAA